MGDTVLIAGVFSPECWGVFCEGIHQLARLEVRGIVSRVDYYWPCALAILSKVVGYLIIAGSLSLKLPQLLSIWRAKSAAGLSALSFELDALVFIASVVYSVKQGFAFSTYGEQVIVLAQNLALVLCVWWWASPRLGTARVCAAAAVGTVATTAICCTPQSLLWLLPAMAIAASLAARVPQLLANASQKHTGQLSGATLKLNVLGGAARVLTTLVETRDPVMLFGYGTSLVLNSALVAQVSLYRDNTERERATRAHSERAESKYD